MFTIQKIPNLIVIVTVLNILGFVLSDDPSVNCTLLNDKLANGIANFSKCALTHSRPIKLCEQCVNEYIEVLNAYGNLSKLKDKYGFCINGYIHLDKLEILQTLYDNSNNLWNQANCDRCFQINNKTLTNVLSDVTVQFNELFNLLTECIGREDVNVTTVCKKCGKEYEELNKHYIEISNEKKGTGTCMDIVDVMNGTREYWSTACCKFRHKNEIEFILSTVIIMVLTILFYVLTKVCSEKRIPVILKQTRFAGSFCNNIDDPNIH